MRQLHRQNVGSGLRRTPRLFSIFLAIIFLVNLFPTYAMAKDREYGTDITFNISSNIPLTTGSAGPSPKISLRLRWRSDGYINDIPLSSNGNDNTYSGYWEDAWGCWSDDIQLSILNYDNVQNTLGKKVIAIYVNGISIPLPDALGQNGQEISIDNFKPKVYTRWTNTEDNIEKLQIIFTTHSDGDLGGEFFFDERTATISVQFEFEDIANDDYETISKEGIYKLISSSDETGLNIAPNPIFVQNELRDGVGLAYATLADVVGTTYDVPVTPSHMYRYAGYKVEGDDNTIIPQLTDNQNFRITITEDTTLHHVFEPVTVTSDDFTPHLYVLDNKNGAKPTHSMTYGTGPGATNIKLTSELEAGQPAYIDLVLPVGGRIDARSYTLNVYSGTDTSEDGTLLVSYTDKTSPAVNAQSDENALHTGIYLEKVPEDIERMTAVLDWTDVGTFTIPIYTFSTADPTVKAFVESYRTHRADPACRAFWYYLDWVYEDALPKILAAKTDEEAQAILKRMEDAAYGIGATAAAWMFKEVDGVSAEPILFALPYGSADNQVKTSAYKAMGAALDARYDSWRIEAATGGAFGAFICHVKAGSGNGGRFVEDKTVSSGFNYGIWSHNGIRSDVGVSGWTVQDGDAMAWDYYNHNYVWNRAVLNFYFGEGNWNAADLDISNLSASPETLNALKISVPAGKTFLDKNGELQQYVDFIRYGRWREPSTYEKVERLIAAIGNVVPTKECGDAIKAARVAYDALTSQAEKNQVKTDGYLDTLEKAEAAYKLMTEPAPDTPSGQDYTSVLSPVLTYLMGIKEGAGGVYPSSNTTCGEWALLSLARFYGRGAGDPLGLEEWFGWYEQSLARKLNNNTLDPDGKTPTEYARVVIGLTSMGVDASAYTANGTTYNLTEPLLNYSTVTGQGINAAAFALIALDTQPYLPNNTNIRDTYVNWLLSKRISNSGWSYSSTTEADPDMTAMVIQALAPYYGSDNRVKTAVDDALNWLKSQQTDHGGFICSGDYNAESAAQVIVALCALKIDPSTWGNGRLINALLSFYSATNANGVGFKHTLSETYRNQMATEQAAYALVAYHRFLNGPTSLYDMSDLFEGEVDPGPDPTEALDAAETKVRNALKQFDSFPENPDEDSVKEWVDSKLGNLNLGGVTYEVTFNGVTNPVAGTSDKPEGTPGKVEFTVTLTAVSGSTQDSRSLSFEKELPAQPYRSDNTGVQLVSVKGTAGKISGNQVTVTLPFGTDTATVETDDFTVMCADSNASASACTKNADDSWSFTVTAENGNTAVYTVTLTVAASEEEFIAEQVEAAKSILLQTAHEKPLPSGIVTETNAGSDSSAKSAIENWLNSLLTGNLAKLTRTIEILTYNAPTISADGSYTAKVTFTIPTPSAAPVSEPAEDDTTAAPPETAVEPADPDEDAEFIPPAEEEPGESDEEHFSFEIGGDDEEDEGSESGQEEPSVPPQEDSPEQQMLSVVSYAFYDVETQEDESGVTYVVVNISGTIPKLPYTASTDTGVTSVYYGTTALERSGSTFTLQLENGMTAPASGNDFTVVLSDSKATVHSWEKTTAGWRFTVKAESGATYTYTVNVNAAPTGPSLDENKAAVEAAAAKISRLEEWDVEMSAANNAASLATFIQTKLIMAGLNGVKAAVDVTFKPATAGTASNPQGTIGNYAATVTLSKGSGSTLASKEVEVTGYILPTAYEAKPTGDITVYFTLLGDDDHGTPSSVRYTHTLADGNLNTWIPRQTVTVPAGSTVGDVFAQVLDEWGYRYVGLESNYIKTIITPRGLRLSEFTNGQLSGWMYTVNGEHPNQGLNKWTVYDGDEIIWHYTDDYTKERGGTGSSNTGSSSGELNPTVSGGSASVSTSAFEDAIDAALQNRLSEILISPADASRLDSLSVDLPTDALYEAARSGLGVTVESGAGIVTIPSGALSSIARTARGYDVTIDTTAQSSYQGERLLSSRTDLTDDQLANCSVTEVTMTSGRTAITSWGGGAISLSLPVDSRYFEARERYTVYQISDDGSMEEHTGRCVKQGGILYVEIDVTHLSTFITVPNAVEETKNLATNITDVPQTLPSLGTNYVILPFADAAGHWALQSIGYVYQTGLMSGTSASAFQPETEMSRAMFVTVLHRLAGRPAPTGVMVYTDVKPNTWYTDAVAWATSTGIVNGTGAATFSPNASISREEMATMMMRYAKYKGYDTAATTDLTGYADVYQIHDWAYRAMEWAGGTGMITGRTAFTLVPQGTATRAETATILVRFIQKFMPSKY